MDIKFTFRILFLLSFLFTGIIVFGQTSAEEYQTAIQRADNYFQNGDYMNAKASYQLASRLNPDEQYPKDRLKESLKLLRVQVEQNGEYKTQLKIADELFEQKSYVKAIAAYEQARLILPEKTYPDKKISECNNLIEAERANRAQYNKLLSEADALFKSEDYDNAKLKYEQSLDYLDYEQYPKDQIAAIDKILTSILQQQSEYEKAMSEAENFIRRKDYQNAVLSYEKAAELNPEATEPTIKLSELNTFLQSYERYTAIVTEADDLYVGKMYAEAKVKYEAALEILPDEAYPKDIIKNIKAILNEKAVSDWEKYDELIAEADQLFSQEDYEKAMETYENALHFKPDGDYARDKINSINDILDLRKSKEEAYTNTIARADELFKTNDYNGAKTEYEKAHDIKPMEQYPKVKIDEIDALLANLKNKLDIYNLTVDGADKLFDIGDYEEALGQYKKALEVLPDKQYPKDKISVINDILDRADQTRQAYEKAIANADLHLENREYEDAKVDYITAMEIIPEEQYPRDQLGIINGLLAEIKAKEENFGIALKNADQLYQDKKYEAALMEYRSALEIKNDDYASQKVDEINNILENIANEQARDKAYEDAVAQADKLFAEEKYIEAKDFYRQALSSKPDEELPRNKIAEIDGLLSSIAAQKVIDDQYTAAITEADNLLTDDKLTEAKIKYDEALRIKPSETYPIEQKLIIDNKLEELASQKALDDQYADKLAAAQQYLDSDNLEGALLEYRKALELKPAESLPANKITEIEATLENNRVLNENYNNAIASADKLFDEKKYAEALQKYKEAENIFPDIDYPKYKITETASIIEEIERKNELDEQYTLSITKGDNFFNEKQYNEAILSFKDASQLKPEEEYPINKIAEIEGIINDIAAQQKILDDYNAAIAQADQLYNTQNWIDAKIKYQDAIIVKADEEYPRTKIKDIDEKLTEIARLQDIENRYNTAILQADELFSSKSFEDARSKYNEALLVKPGEAYPNQKLEEIKILLSELAMQKAIDAEYNQLISKADEFFDANILEDAKGKYEEASIVKPEEQYPKDRITEINIRLEEIAAQKIIDTQYNEAINLADEAFNKKEYSTALQEYQKAQNIKPEEAYPGKKIIEINSTLSQLAEERDRAYDVLITRADNLLNEGKYKGAMEAYSAALQIKPNETYPKRKNTEAETLYLAEREAKEVEYRKAIGDADNFFNDNIYDKAIEKYEEAISILPEEAYPIDQIALMKKIINDNAIVDVNQDPLLIQSNNEKKFTFNPMPVSVRKENYILIKAKNPVDRNFKIYMNFGEDNTKNGGIAIRVPETADEKEFLIRIGGLYKWFSEDNNWLSIYPEGGDIEVSLIRISKSN